MADPSPSEDRCSISASRSSSRFDKYPSDSFGKLVCRNVLLIISCAIG
jgi:hypothetical protein